MKRYIALAACTAALVGAAPGFAQPTPFVGQITPYGFNWCPNGWTQAAGQLLPISSHQALFSLYGTTYGGDGRTTFGLPDLRGHWPTNHGQSPGTSNYALGQRGGVYELTLNITQLANHTHTFNGTSGAPNTQSINGATLATFPSSQSAYADPAALPETMNTAMVATSGGNLSFDTRQPWIAANYCVALQGIFPSRP